MTKLSSFFAFLTFIVPFYASANCSSISCTGNINDLFTNVYLTHLSDGIIYLELNDAYRTGLDCALTEGRSIELKSSHPLFKETYSTILTAISLNKQVFVRVPKAGACELYYLRMFM